MLLVRSEPLQGPVAVRFVTKETWREIRAGHPEPGQAFAAAGELEMFRSPAWGEVSRFSSRRIQQRDVIRCRSGDGWERERALHRAPSKGRAISAAKGQGPDVPPKNQGVNCPRKVETTLLPCGGGSAVLLRWWKPDMSWPKGKSRAAGHHSSTCGAAGTSTLTSLASWAC